MSRQQAEVLTGPRGARGPETVTSVVSLAEAYPATKGQTTTQEQVHFISSAREYSVLVFTEPDRVGTGGNIIVGRNKSVRFRDFNLITDDVEVIAKLRGLKQYGLGREVWEKWQQDERITARALAAAEATFEALPEQKQAEFLSKLGAKFKSFPLPKQNTAEEQAAAEIARMVQS